MSVVLRKIKSFYRIFFVNRPSKVTAMGEKILILFTGPSARAYYEYESVQRQFADYDLAVVNFTLANSVEYVHRFKPKYFFFLDPIYYDKDARNDIPDWMSKDCDRTFAALEAIDWNYYIISPQLSEWTIRNPHAHFVNLSVLKKDYRSCFNILYKKNIVNPGFNNVVIGALYYTITYGFKKVAILGCPYRNIDYEKKSDGIHIYEHLHYYDTEPWNVFISNEEIKRMKDDYSIWLAKRSLDNLKALKGIVEYAKNENVEIINYSEGSQMTMIDQGDLDVPEGTDITFVDDRLYRYK